VLTETVEVYNLEAVEDSNSIVTFVNDDLVPGLFSSWDLSISCHTSEMTPARKVNKNIKERYKLPKKDPSPNPEWHMASNSPLEDVVYLISLYVDRISRDLGEVWSQIIKRDVEKPEHFSITALTNSEMLKLISDFIKANSDNNSDQLTCISEVNQLSSSVSTCMSSYLASNFTLPNIPVIVNQGNNANLMVELAMLDTGSEISLHVIPLNNNSKKLVFKAKESFQVGAGTHRS